jgi:hypothetical protein
MDLGRIVFIMGRNCKSIWTANIIIFGNTGINKYTIALVAG